MTVRKKVTILITVFAAVRTEKISGFPEGSLIAYALFSGYLMMVAASTRATCGLVSFALSFIHHLDVGVEHLDCAISSIRILDAYLAGIDCMRLWDTAALSARTVVYANRSRARTGCDWICSGAVSVSGKCVTFFRCIWLLCWHGALNCKYNTRRYHEMVGSSLRNSPL